MYATPKCPAGGSHATEISYLKREPQFLLTSCYLCLGYDCVRQNSIKASACSYPVSWSHQLFIHISKIGSVSTDLAEWAKTDTNTYTGGKSLTTEVSVGNNLAVYARSVISPVFLDTQCDQ